jgi:nicotinate-nucleotide adenylyltransferase
MKIALLFGSFNPIHHGHTAMAQAAVDAGFDEVWFVVSPQNPLKDPAILAPAEHRLALVQLAIQGNEKWVLRDDEMHLPLPSYSIQTLTHFQNEYPQHTFSFLCGTDVFLQLPQWYKYEELLSRISFLVCKRHTETSVPPAHLAAYAERFTFIPFEPVALSSTEVRAHMHEKPAGIDEGVWQYIQQHHLYGVSNQ